MTDRGLEAEAARLGAKWRLEAEGAPVLDLRAADPRPAPKTAHRVEQLSLLAILTRDVGYFTHPERLLPDEAWERCFHFSLAYGAITRWGQTCVHRHDLTRAFCEGAFGLWLPEVWAQPPGPGLDQQRDRWRFRLFVAEDWRTPIRPKILRRPPTYVTWAEYLETAAAAA